LIFKTWEGANGGGEVALTYQRTRLKSGQPETYFETEKLPYKTKEEGEALMQQHLKYLRKL